MCPVSSGSAVELSTHKSLIHWWILDAKKPHTDVRSRKVKLNVVFSVARLLLDAAVTHCVCLSEPVSVSAILRQRGVTVHVLLCLSDLSWIRKFWGRSHSFLKLSVDVSGMKTFPFDALTMICLFKCWKKKKKLLLEILDIITCLNPFLVTSWRFHRKREKSEYFFNLKCKN